MDKKDIDLKRIVIMKNSDNSKGVTILKIYRIILYE